MNRLQPHPRKKKLPTHDSEVVKRLTRPLQELHKTGSAYDAPNKLKLYPREEKLLARRTRVVKSLKNTLITLQRLVIGVLVMPPANFILSKEKENCLL